MSINFAIVLILVGVYPVYMKIMIADRKAFDILSQLFMDYYLNAQLGEVRTLAILWMCIFQSEFEWFFQVLQREIGRAKS